MGCGSAIASTSSTSASVDSAGIHSESRMRRSAVPSSCSSARRTSRPSADSWSSSRMVDPAYAPGIRTLRVPDGSGGRVDRYVADATGLSRSYVQKLISDGRLTSAGEPLRSNAIVTAGTDLRLDVPEPAALDLEPAPEIPLTIVYEDDDLLILDKPAGLVVHPAPGHSGDTLVNALLAHGDGSTWGGI